MNDPINEKVHETALVLANAGELAAALIRKISGNDISTAVNGSPLTREMIQAILFRKIATSATKA